MPYYKKQISEELAISHLGLKNLEDVYWNLPTPRLYEPPSVTMKGMWRTEAHWWCEPVILPAGL